MNRRIIAISGIGLLVGVAIVFALWWRTASPRTPTAGPHIATVASDPSDPDNPSNSAKRAQITSLLDRAQATPPTTAEAEEMFGLVRDDPAYFVKVRAIAVLPFVRERERAIDVLIAALKDRDPEASGSGNVPTYATKYLADMNATRAIPAIEDWLAFLERQKPYSDEMRSMSAKKGKEDLTRLKAGGTVAH